MDSAIRTAITPIVRARRSELSFVRGRLYDVRARYIEHAGRWEYVVADEFGGADVRVTPRLFAPVNAVAARLMAPPAASAVRAYRRRVLRAIRGVERATRAARDEAARIGLDAHAAMYDEHMQAIWEVLDAVRKVRS